MRYVSRLEPRILTEQREAADDGKAEEYEPRNLQPKHMEYVADCFDECARPGKQSTSYFRTAAPQNANRRP